MKFKMPETLDGLALEKISELRDAAIAEATELNKIADDKITPEESARLIELAGNIGTLSERQTTLDTEAKKQADELAAARAALGEATKPAEKSEPAPKDEKPKDEKSGDAPKGDAKPADEAPKAEVEAPKVEADALVAAAMALLTAAGSDAGALTAGGAPSKAFSFAARVGANAKEPILPTDGTHDMNQALSITASANIPGFESGQKIESFDQLAEAYQNRASSFASGTRSARRGAKQMPTTYGGDRLSAGATRFNVAQLKKPDNEFTLTEDMSTQAQYDLIMKAANESRLGGGSLLASGGWCSPSEITYGFLELESAEGLLSIAELNAPRGGIQHTKGPQLGDLLLATDLGFVQTEVEAEAGDVKPVFDIECPDWDEVRMDAIGWAMRAGLLTNTTFPELLRRYLALATIVHARRMNRLTIQRISALIGTATTFAPVASVAGAYSAVSDILAAVELQAIRIREKYSMPLNSTVEGVFPIWLPAAIRSELTRRGGVDFMNVSDEQIKAWFAARKINAQWVRDYQSIGAGAASTAGGTAAWTRFPDKVEFMLYPAGAYVRLATPVINLDTVYDTDDLTKNQFMAAFFEEGFGIANTGGDGVKCTVAIDNLYGLVGADRIGLPAAA